MGRLIGLDLGTRTCGIAISDPMGIIASGYENYRFKENDFDDALNHVKEVCEKMNIEKIVIGLPKHMNGDLGEVKILIGDDKYEGKTIGDLGDEGGIVTGVFYSILPQLDYANDPTVIEED